MERLYVYLRNTMKTFRLRLCCCFAPLRPGIMFLGYCSIAAAVIQLIGVASSSALPLIGDVQSTVADDQTSPLTAVLAPAADLAFNILLVAAMHRKDVVLLRGYMWCGAASLAAALVAYSLVLPVLSAFFITRIVFSMVYQIYMIILVRSYIVEIELNRRASQHLYYKSDLIGADPTGAATLRIVHEVKDAVSRSGTLQRGDHTSDREAAPITVTVTPPAEEGDTGRKTPEIRKYTSVYGLGRTLGTTPLSATGSHSQTVSVAPNPSTSTDPKPADSKSVVEVKDADKSKAKTESKDAKSKRDSKDGGKPKSDSKNDDCKSATTSKSSDVSKIAVECKVAADTKEGEAAETSTQDDKQTEVPPKKKRGFFKRTPKVSKSDAQ